MPRARRVSALFLPVFLGTFLLVGAVLPAGHSHAKNNGLQEVSASEKQRIFDKFRLLRRDMRSIHASVVQEKQAAALKKKIVVKGTVTLAKPNMLKWDVVKPERSVTVIDGETMTVYHPAVKEAQVYTLSENIIAHNTMTFFSSVMSGDMTEMEGKFSVSVFRNGSEVVIRLVPKSKLVGRYLAGVVIHVDEKTALPNGFEVSTPRGDKTITRLTNIKVNPELTSGAFQLKMPPGVWITNKVEPISD
jgi:outer membrane lipoprotein-sorting protein